MDSKGRRGPRAAAPATPGEPEEKASVVAEPAAPASEPEAADLARQAYDALALSQAVMARGFEALGLEIVGLARSGIDRAAKTAGEMLAVKTLSDAVEVNAGFARDSFDSFLEGSTRLSELGVKLAREAAAPLLARWQQDWAKAFGPGF